MKNEHGHRVGNLKPSAVRHRIIEFAFKGEEGFTNRLSNFRRPEPDGPLVADYELVDETGPYEIPYPVEVPDELNHNEPFSLIGYVGEHKAVAATVVASGVVAIASVVAVYHNRD